VIELKTQLALYKGAADIYTAFEAAGLAAHRIIPESRHDIKTKNFWPSEGYDCL